jgi:hypothetical protein
MNRHQFQVEIVVAIEAFEPQRFGCCRSRVDRRTGSGRSSVQMPGLVRLQPASSMELDTT